MTIRDAVAHGGNALKLAGIDSFSLDAQLLLAHVLGVSRLFVLTENKELTQTQLDEFKSLITKRATRYPLQYMLGKCEFYGLEFEVTEAVLIPRPDTETLVDAVLQNVANNSATEVLEIGAGSGCISISLAKNRPNFNVDAIDISDAALAIACKNAQKHDVKINFAQADIFKWTPEKAYDIIVSNPPYIERNIISTLQPEVAKFEPKPALDGGVDGLDFYRKITEIPVKKFIALELGHNQFDAVAEIFANQGFTNITAHRDLAGIRRVLVAHSNTPA